MQAESTNNHKTDIYIETSTLHDDDYLSCHEIFTSTKTESFDTSMSAPSKAYNCAGGFSFNLKSDNRFIIWKIIGNKLEFIEHSLTHKLAGNFKRIHFKDAMIIPKIHIYKYMESENSSVFSLHILLATTSKLFRLVLKYNKNEHINQSIFSGMSSMNFSNIDVANSFQINLSLVESTDIFVNQRGEAFFAFVLPNNSICCVQMPSYSKSLYGQNNTQNLPLKFEINQPNIVKRLWSGITRTAQDSASGFVSFKFFPYNDNPYFVCLCKDFKLKLWCIKTNQCIFVEELSKFFKSDLNIIWNESKIDAISVGDNSILTILLSTNDQFRLCNLKVTISNSNEVLLNEVSKRTLSKNGELISIQCTNFNTWITYKNEKEQVEIISVPIYENRNLNSSKMPNDIQIINFTQKDSILQSQMNDSDHEGDEQFNEEELDDEKINEQILSEMDLKELYLKKIFEPFRYSKQNMLKSLGILGIHQNEINFTHLNNDEIKQKIIKAIEQSIQSHPNYANISEEDFLSLNMKFWSKYFTMLKQYDFDSRLPLGFYIEPQNESIIILIRKNSLSLYNRADLSQFYLSSPTESIKSFLHNYLRKDDNELNDLMHLISTLRCIDSNLKTHPNLNFLSYQKDVDFEICNQYIHELTEYLTMIQKDFFGKFGQYFEKVNNLDHLDRTLHNLFSLLCLNKNNEQFKFMDGDDIEQDMETDSNSLKITSDFTIENIIASFRSLVQTRFEFYRNISVLVNIINRYYSKIDVSSHTASEINQKFFESSINNMASYLYLKWLSDLYPYSIHQESIIKHLRRTSNLLEDFKFDQSNHNKDANILFLKSFLTFTNQFSIQTQSNYLELNNYSQLNEYISKKIMKFIWPMNLEDNLTLIKYFIYNIQYIHLINYCSMTKWNLHSKNLRSFIMGHCCLFLNNIDQSIGFFLRASYNLEKNVFLKKLLKLGQSGPNISDTARANQYKNSRRSIIINNRSNLTARSFDRDLNESDDNVSLLDFYTKIIHYYDLNGNLEAAIELIQNALLKCQFDAKSKSKLYCILFKSYMDLEYFDKAYTSMMSNSDLEWKKICLKTFITELCNQNKTDILVSFDYGELLSEVFNILMSRAKSSDLRNNDFYRVLFALYVKIKDYRKAALCMYECYLRLKHEIIGINSLNRQEKCLLACLNMLKLVETKFAWLNITDLGQLSSEIQLDTGSKLKIIDIDEINKNYLMVSYTLKICNISKNQNLLAGSYTIKELTSQLTKNGFFDDALNLCLSVRGSDQGLISSILMSLVDRCCNLNPKELSDERLSDDAMTEIEMIKKNYSVKTNISPYENPYSFKWKILESFLERLNDSVFYKQVCQQILINGYDIPLSIQYKFKKNNSQALLSIYLNYGLWDEAMDLIKEIIAISNSTDLLISGKQTDTLIPFSLIDTLNKYCKSQTDKNNDISELQIINSELNETINDYLHSVKSSSDAYINLKRKI